MGSSVEAEGETIDEAIAKALTELGAAREEVRVEILSGARRGVLGFGGQKARVRVLRREPGEPPGDDGVDPAAAAEAGAEAGERLREVLRLMDVPGDVEVAAGSEPGQVVLRVSSEASAVLIGRHGQTLDALEYLVNRIAGRHDERAPRVAVDVEGYRERREHELQEMARRIAEKVRRTKKPETMNPLSARERRVVHLALADTGVTTRSVGEGGMRRVVVSPSSDRVGGAPTRR